ncbi:monovalent cation/H(+) antiporter subunit G [Bacillus massiliglaciei]|uniref:monovalent cation/H(+) antiporter subunit G n=1 Tax=Bacillus massiliglaciei TaxID=1816693 RepID=UPI000ACF61A1|nr:monovalent cation/H(+) antiporter subunit G [Bacillus massiliglaciei]
MSIKDVGEILGALFVLAGSVLTFLSAIGLIRLPDVYTRSHAASKSATLGVLCILLGTLLYFIFSEGYFSIRLILGILFVFLTAPVAAHLICRVSYRTNVELTNSSVRDDLKAVFEKEKGIVRESENTHGKQ